MSGRLFGSYNFTPVWGVQGFAFYRGNQVQLQGNQSGQGFYTLGVKRDFAEKRGSIGFGFDNFFTPEITVRNTVVSPLINQASQTVVHSLGFRVNLNYRIGKMTVAPTRRGKSVNNDDLKGDGGGGDAGGNGGMPGGGGGGAPAGGGARPAGAPTGAPGGGYPGQPRPAPATDSPGGRPVTDSTARPQPGQRPGGYPGLRPTTAQPADTTRRLPVAPVPNPINAPVNAPSPGTTTPGGITPAGSPGGRP